MSLSRDEVVYIRNTLYSVIEVLDSALKEQTKVPIQNHNHRDCGFPTISDKVVVTSLLLPYWLSPGVASVPEIIEEAV